MSQQSTPLLDIYETLLDHFGPQHWWPGDSPLEIMIGAILTQNTNWANVEKAMDNIKAAQVLQTDRLYQMDRESLSELIRPAGYYRLKAERLKHYLTWFVDQYQGNLAQLSQVSTRDLRDELLAIKGIGPETADSILLYALNRPIFVVDTYTARMAVRHRLIDGPFDYHQLQEIFMDALPMDVTLYNEFHALLVALGKHFCRPKARCSECPLEHIPHEFVP